MAASVSSPACQLTRTALEAGNSDSEVRRLGTFIRVESWIFRSHVRFAMHF